MSAENLQSTFQNLDLEEPFKGFFQTFENIVAFALVTLLIF